MDERFLVHWASARNVTQGILKHWILEMCMKTVTLPHTLLGLLFLNTAAVLIRPSGACPFAWLSIIRWTYHHWEG